MRDLLVERGRAHAPSRPSSCLALARISTDRHLLRRAGARARRTPRAAGRGPGRARRRDRGLHAARHRPRPRSSPTSRSPAGSTTTPARSSRPASTATRASARSARAVATTPSPRDGRTTYPGVGISLGRQPGARAAAGQGRASRPTARCRAPCWSPWSTRSAGATSDAARRAAARATACPARCRPRRQKFGKQIRYAERRGIPYVLFPGGRRQPPEVKDIRSGEQPPVDLATWTPPVEDLRPASPANRQLTEEHAVIRTHDAGSLRAEDVDTEVTLAGWVARRRDHGGVAFIDLREASGVVQVVIRDEAVAHNLRNEYCLKVTGTVSLRPEGNQNAGLPTGEIEVIATDVEVLSDVGAAAVPDRRRHVGVTSARRRGCGTATSTCAAAAPTPPCGCAARSTRRPATCSTRTTSSRSRRPTLTRSTPEGARDFLVPARLQPGSWYALPQSPQLFKQLLMVAGMERYYQIARCYRDEDFRADRQPEFTQLDVEMSFVEQDDVIALTEEILTALWALIGVRGADAAAAADLRRGDGPVRLRQARPADGPGARRLHRVLRRHPVPRLPGAVRRSRGHARRSEPAAQAARRLAGVGQAARRPRPGLPARQGGRRAHRPGRQEHQRRGEGRHRRARRRRAGRLHLLRAPARSRAAVRCSVPPGSRSAAAAA